MQCRVHNIYAIAVQENMTRMFMITDVQDIIKRHQAQIITSLKDPDIRLHVPSYVLKLLIRYISHQSYLRSKLSLHRFYSQHIIIHACLSCNYKGKDARSWKFSSHYMEGSMLLITIQTRIINYCCNFLSSASWRTWFGM